MRAAPQKARLWLLGFAVVVLGLLLAPGDLADQAAGLGDVPRAGTSSPAPTKATPRGTHQAENAALASETACDFRDGPKLVDHHARHGADFGSRTPSDYLEVACRLRDAALSQNVVELRRKDGVLCRFRRSDGAFLAYRSDGTILTCFKPERGERYFRDQLEREEH